MSELDKKIDKRFILIARNGDRIYPYKKGQKSTGRYGYPFNPPGERDRGGKGQYTESLEEVIKKMVFEGWKVRATTISETTKPRSGSYAINKKTIIGYEISEDLVHLVKDAETPPSAIIPAFAENIHHIGIRPAPAPAPAPAPVIDEKIFREILTRRGQSDFRSILLKKFNQRCCITKCEIEAVLEAAHIIPHSINQNYNQDNGLILRADIHTLFDLNLLGIDQTGKIHLHYSLQESSYNNYAGHSISDAINSSLKENLARRFSIFTSNQSD